MHGHGLEASLPQGPRDVVVAGARLHDAPRLPRMRVRRIRLWGFRDTTQECMLGGGFDTTREGTQGG